MEETTTTTNADPAAPAVSSLAPDAHAPDAKVTPAHAPADAAAHAAAHAEVHTPHMPPPSLSPIILGAGMTLAAFGIVFGPIVLIPGVIGILIGLGTWLYDEIKNADSAADSATE